MKKKLVLRRETLTALDGSLIQNAIGGSEATVGATCHTYNITKVLGTCATSTRIQ